MRMFIVVILIVRRLLWPDAASGVTNVAGCALRIFQLRDQSFLSRLCHEGVESQLPCDRESYQIKQGIEEHPYDVHEVPVETEDFDGLIVGRFREHPAPRMK